MTTDVDTERRGRRVDRQHWGGRGGGFSHVVFVQSTEALRFHLGFSQEDGGRDGGWTWLTHDQILIRALVVALFLIFVFL